MALTESTMLALGTAAPEFQLPDVVTGKTVALTSFADRPTLLVMFLCRHCPYVQHVQAELARLARDYQARGVGLVGISANDAEHYPDDAPHRLAEWATAQGFTFPLLYDASQQTAQAYTAACTPDFFVFDKARRLVYRGQLDDSRPGNGKPLTGRDLRAALDAVLAGTLPAQEQRPSVGCNIKWKRGNEPSYFNR